MRKPTRPLRIPALAALAAASLAVPQAATTTRANGTSATPRGADTSYSKPYWDSTAGGTGTGMHTAPGRGGSSLDSISGRDTLWSSPYETPATPGTGLPNSPGAGWPGTGSPGSSGNGGSGTGGSGMGGDSSRGVPAPHTAPSVPTDSTGSPATDWMERG